MAPDDHPWVEEFESLGGELAKEIDRSLETLEHYEAAFYTIGYTRDNEPINETFVVTLVVTVLRRVAVSYPEAIIAARRCKYTMEQFISSEVHCEIREVEEMYPTGLYLANDRDSGYVDA